MTKRIGIDLDNTVADFIKGAAPLIQEMFGLVPNMERPAYSIEEVFGVNKETRPERFRERLYFERRLFRHLPKMEENNHQLPTELQSVGVDKIYFVTARDNHPVVLEDTKYWVEENMEHHDDVFHTPDKAAFCQLAGIKVMIEDELRQIVPLVRAGIDVIVMDRPWNRDIPTEPLVMGNPPGRIIRAWTWREAVEAAKEFYHEF